MFRYLCVRVFAGLVAVGVVFGAGAAPAGAHADLVGTEPEYGAVLASGPERAVLRFNYAVELTGAIVKLERSGTALAAGQPAVTSPDGKEVTVPLRDLGPGDYVFTWFIFAQDGHMMGGELAFAVAGAGGPEPVPGGEVVEEGGAVPPSFGQRSFTGFTRAQDAVRWAGFASLAVLVGGVAFVAVLWPAGVTLARTRLLLGAALAGGLAATVADLGLRGAAIQGRSVLGAFSPSAVTALSGTHFHQVLVARLGFLLLAVPVVAYLTLAPHLALRSHRWVIGAGISGLGALATHGLLGHSYAAGPLASAVDVVHQGAVSVWLGGLVVLGAVVLPRRRRGELSWLVPRWSRVAFASIATGAVFGGLLLILISPRWTGLAGSEYGRFLLLKLVLVAGLLFAAARARRFVQGQLPAVTGDEPRPSPAVPGRTGRPVVEAPAGSRVPVGVGTGGLAPMSAPAPTVGSTDADLAKPDRACRPDPDGAVDPVPLRPFVTAVSAELCIAASILAATAVLVGRLPPG